MKRKGLIIAILVLIVVVITVAATYAFYDASKAEFAFVSESAMGNSIALSIIQSNTSLAPKETTAQNGVYTPKDGSQGTSAVYLIEYAAGNNLDAAFFVSGVTYSKDGSAISAGYKSFLDKYLEFSLYRVDDLDTYSLDNLPTPTKWIGQYLNEEISSENTNPTTWIHFDNIPAGMGYMFCFIRFSDTITQELLPLDFDGINIEFTLTSQLLD